MWSVQTWSAIICLINICIIKLFMRSFKRYFMVTDTKADGKFYKILVVYRKRRLRSYKTTSNITTPIADLRE